MKKLFILLLLFPLLEAGLCAQRYDGVIDKTVALVGGDMIMLSEIEQEVQMMQFQGYSSDRNLRCEVLENMMTSKLFLTQAKLDSLNINPDMVLAQLNDRVSNILTQLGGEEATEKYFGKSLFKLRQEWQEAIEEQSLVQQMQQKVAEKAENLTPEDVRTFYKRTPKDSLPVIPTQYQISQICIYPDKEKASLAVRERLLSFRERVLSGTKFSILATMYSEDPGSAMRGGELGMASRSIFWPVFSDAAMALKPDQVSSIVETPDGFHIIQLIERKGDMFNARHILLKPKYTEEDRTRAFSRLDSLKTMIEADSIKFFWAARYYSEDPMSRTNGGVLADPNTGSALFEKDQLKPADYNVLRNMEIDQISAPFESLDNEGRSGNTVYKIIRLDKIIPSHIARYEDDFNILQASAKNKKTQELIEQFVVDKIKTSYIVIDPLFQGCQFSREGWVK
ncbi:MAG: peptidylprolyl isomerase [Bacteroidales bacterium]|nr:peptidylprolyl isomerase [Bacteroidales bacterium]